MFAGKREISTEFFLLPLESRYFHSIILRMRICLRVRTQLTISTCIEINNLKHKTENHTIKKKNNKFKVVRPQPTSTKHHRCEIYYKKEQLQKNEVSLSPHVLSINRDRLVVWATTKLWIVLGFFCSTIYALP